jgi:hypothetical protein
LLTDASALNPKKVLLEPVVIVCPAAVPIPVFLNPVVFKIKELVPIAVF